jgi:hypothetical protein
VQFSPLEVSKSVTISVAMRWPKELRCSICHSKEVGKLVTTFPKIARAQSALTDAAGYLARAHARGVVRLGLDAEASRLIAADSIAHRRRCNNSGDVM